MWAFVLFLALAAPSDEKPRLRLHVSPRIQNARPRETAYIRATVRIQDQGQRLGCFELVWLWGDGCVSTEWPECDPYQLVEERPRLYVPLPRFHAYRRPGTYELVVIAKATDISVRDRQVVMIVEPGALEDPDQKSP